MTIKGKTFNYLTGCSWGAESALMESVPFSNLLIGLNSYPECGFLVKNEGSSRKRITFAHRQRDVLLFELLSKDLFLAKLKG